MSELIDQIRHDVAVLDQVREHLAGRHDAADETCLACHLVKLADAFDRECDDAHALILDLITVTYSMRRSDWVATKLLIGYAQTLQQYDRHRRAAWKLTEDITAQAPTDGAYATLSPAWVAARLEHLARYGCPGPQGRPCIHDDSEAWSP